VTTLASGMAETVCSLVGTVGWRSTAILGSGSKAGTIGWVGSGDEGAECSKISTAGFRAGWGSEEAILSGT